MSIVQYISALILPAIILVFAIIILVSKKEPMSSFYSGAKQGLKSSIDLMPGLCLLVIGINMLTASGATDALSGISKYQYSLDNTTWQDSGTFSGIKSGTETTVYAKAID